MVQILNRISTSEAHLVGSAIAGEKSAYAELYKAHFDTVLAKVSQKFSKGDPDKAHDLVQQAFTDVFDNLRDIDRGIPFADSVIEAVHDRVISDDHRSTAKLHDFISMAEESLKHTACPDADPADVVAATQATNSRLAALETMMALDKATDKKYAAGIRYLFAMCERNLSAEDIAKSEKTTPAAVRKAMERACTALKPVLAPYIA